MSDADQVLLDDEDAVFLQLRSEQRVRFLRHRHQNVGPRDVGIENRLIRQDDLRAAGAATGFGAEGLGHGGVAGLRRCSRPCR